jgi:hypothetical protein
MKISEGIQAVRLWFVFFCAAAMLSGCQASAGTSLPEVSPSITPVDATPTASTRQVKVFLIGLEGSDLPGKKIGCNDTVVAYPVEVNSAVDPLLAALVMLFSAEEVGLGKAEGLYNSYQQSNLEVVEAFIDDQGTAHVRLSGEFLIGGVCDTPRAQAQIQETIFQFPEAKAADITINGTPFDRFFQQGP